MGYYLGVDIGTTYTAAAVWRDGRCDVASLGNRAPTIPSVVFIRADGTVLVGEAAVRRASSEPAQVAREFKRRVGDPTPVIVGGTPYSADALMGRLLRAVVDLVVQAEGGAPDGIAVTHPANWGPYKLDLLRQATRLADLDDVTTVTEPEAAAIHYASQARVEPGAVIAVYDLGGGTFDAAVLRKTDAGYDVLGTPEGIERLGGVDFDAAVYHHLSTAIGPALDDLSPDDAAAMAALARLRQECVDAKEALSSDSDVSIPVLLPSLQTEVRLTRSEYEQMVRPALADSITALTRALRSAHVDPDEVTTVLLVGGSSRTPLVAEMVSTALRRPVAVDAHPKYGVALGAAITAAQAGGKRSAGDDTTIHVPPGEATPAPALVAGAAPSTDTIPAAGPVPATATAAATTAVAGSPATAPPSTGPRPAGEGTRPPTAAPGAAPPSPAPAGQPGRVEPARPATNAPQPTAAMPAAPARGGEPGSAAGPSRDTRSVRVPYTGEQPAASPAAGGSAVPIGPAQPPSTGAGDHRIASADTGDGPPPSRHPVRAGRPSPRRGLLAAAAAVAVVVLAVGAFLAFSGDGDGGDNAGTTGDPGTTGDGTGAEASASGDGGAATAGDGTEAASPEGPFVEISDVTVEDGRYRVEYQVHNYVPELDGPPDSLHVHFFPDTQPPATAGTNGPDGSDWDVTDAPTSFLTKYTVAERGSATRMCSAVANVDHSVHTPETRTGNCVDLPT